MLLTTKIKNVKEFLKKNYPSESNKNLNNFLSPETLLLKMGSFISSTNSFIKCPETDQCLVKISRITSIDNITSALLFQKGFYLKEDEVFHRLYFEYKDVLQNKFCNHPELFSLSSKSDRSFLLEFDRKKLPLNYINYLKLMSLVPSFSCNSNAYDLNIYDIHIKPSNPVSHQPFYGINNAISNSVSVYENGSEFFLKINYSINIKNLTHSNYTIEELINIKYNTILCYVYGEYQNIITDPSIYIDEADEVLNVYTIINISKANEFEWDFLYEVPYLI